MKPVRLLQTVLAVSVVVSGSPTSAETQCRHGTQDISLTLLLSSGKSLALHVPTDYFDQRFIPADGSSRDGLLLRTQATDFSPWPRGIRPHISEGPFLSYLLTEFVPLDIGADRLERGESGYSMLGAVEWVRTPGPFGLYTLSGPPPEGTHPAPRTRENDLYVAVDGQGETTDIIMCLRPGRTPFQHCDHLIEAGEIDIKLYYAPEFLPDWARISSSAKEFLQCLKGE